MLRLSLAVSVVFVAAAFALPAAALAAGTVATNAGGDITYTGDAAANIVELSTSPTGPGNVIFEETGITQGTDTAGICFDGAGDTIICDFDTSDQLTADGVAGADQLTAGGPLEVELEGGSGDDQLTGGAGDANLSGDDDDDRLIGGTGDDNLNGGSGADEVFGNAGNDFAPFDAGDGDLIDVGAGRDVFFIHNGDGTGDTLRGGSGVDALVYLSVSAPPAPAFRFDLQNGTFGWAAAAPFPAGTGAISGVEDVGSYDGMSTADILIGSATSNLLAGGGGADQIDGRAGTDTLLGDDSLVPIGGLGAAVLAADPENSGSDTITARDGFQDRLDCGPEADTALIDQFDGPDTENCESAPVASVFPFGIAPPAAPDTTAPVCKRSKLARKKRRTFLRRGFSFRFNCNEQARVEVFAAVTAKRRKGGKVVFSKAGDVLLAHKVFGFRAGSRTLSFKAAKSVRRSLAKRFKVRLRIDATDRAGNRRTTRASLSVR
jgi:Ca2+-binding RTX toxin-like protein